MNYPFFLFCLTVVAAVELNNTRSIIREARGLVGFRGLPCFSGLITSLILYFIVWDLNTGKPVIGLGTAELAVIALLVSWYALLIVVVRPIARKYFKVES